MPLPRLLAALGLLILTLGAMGCGPSEGQNVMTYLGSVTIHERRLQATAEEIQAVLPLLQKTPPEVAAAQGKVKAALQSVRESSAELKNLHVPESAANLSQLYAQAFQVALDRLELLSQALDQAAAGTPRPTAPAVARLTELKAQAADLDEKIRLAKIELAKAWPEVQVPEADPPPTAPKP